LDYCKSPERHPCAGRPCIFRTFSLPNYGLSFSHPQQQGARSGNTVSEAAVRRTLAPRFFHVHARNLLCIMEKLNESSYFFIFLFFSATAINHAI
jgi:hypothetical protein